MDSNGFNNDFGNGQTNENNEFFSNEQYEAPQIPDKGAIFAEKIRGMFTSSAYLTATIAYTVMAGVSFILGSLDIFAILFTIGMWLAYSAASKATPLKEMKFLSGVLKAYYIVTVIGIVLMIISGVLCIVCGPLVMNMENEVLEALKQIETEAGELFYIAIGNEVTYFTVDELVAKAFELFGLTLSAALGIILIILGVVLIIAAVIMILLNEFFIHKLGKQFTKAIDAIVMHTDAEISLNGVRAFAIILGVLTAISAVSTFVAFDIIMAISEGAYAVAYFALASAMKERANTPDTVQPML